MNRLSKLVLLFLLIFLFSGCLNNDDPDDYVVTRPTLVDSNLNIDTVGAEVKIGDEYFYIISSDSTTVTMLSKWNLLVGNKVMIESSNGYGYGPMSKDIEGYGIQSDTAKGEVEGEKIWLGGWSFTENSSYYWHFETSDPIYVFNSKSCIYKYVAGYRNILQNNYNIHINDARLIKIEELVSLGCVAPRETYLSGNCFEAPVWVYQTSYWTGSAMEYFALHVGTNGYINDDSYDDSLKYGVRPVIVISKDLFL